MYAESITIYQLPENCFFNTMFEMFKSEAVTDKLSGSLKKRPDTWLFRKNQNVNFYISNAGLR